MKKLIKVADIQIELSPMKSSFKEAFCESLSRIQEHSESRTSLYFRESLQYQLLLSTQDRTLGIRYLSHFAPKSLGKSFLEALELTRPRYQETPIDTLSFELCLKCSFPPIPEGTALIKHFHFVMRMSDMK